MPEMKKDSAAKSGKKGIFANKRFKYGAAAVGLTAAFVAVIVVINVMFSALATNFKWYIDMTTEGLYSVSDAVHELLDPMNDREDVHIKIIFCSEEDELRSSYYSNLVYQSALLFEDAFDFIEVYHVDVNAHPGEVSAYRTTSGSQIRTNSVIITNTVNGDYRTLTTDSFYTIDQDTSEPYALNAEYKITTAILQMTEKNPIAYFTVDNGEQKTESSALWSLLVDAGYDVREIDLSREEIDYDNAQLIVINGPQYDLAGAGADVNEVKKIDDFLDNVGNLMVFMDPTASSKQDFSNLEELLSEWGISFGDEIVYDPSSSINVDGTAIVANYTEEGSGAALTKSMRSLENVPQTIVSYAMPINVTYRNGESETIDQGSREITAVLTSSEDSYTRKFGSEEVSEKGATNLMTLTTELRYIDNEAHTNFVLACGTTEFVTDKYIGSGSYGNVELMFSAMKTMGKVTVPNGIVFKIFDNNNLTITSSEAYAWTVALTVLLPIVTAIVGIAVHVRRRHL